jgi:hypothetical protein
VAEGIKSFRWFMANYAFISKFSVNIDSYLLLISAVLRFNFYLFSVKFLSYYFWLITGKEVQFVVDSANNPESKNLLGIS